MIIEAVNSFRPNADVKLRMVQDEDTVKIYAQTKTADDDDGWGVLTFHEDSKGRLAVEVHGNIYDELIATDSDGCIVVEG